MTGDAARLPPARVRTRRPRDGVGSPVTALNLDSRALLGPAPVTALEDRALYEMRLASLLDDLAPADAIERMWVKDIADLDWEVDRLKRAKVVAIAMAEEGVLAKLFKSMPVADGGRAMELTGGDRAEAADYLTARARAQDGADELTQCALDYSGQRIRLALAKFGLSEAHTGGAALLDVLDTVERLDRLIQIAGRRRDAVIRDLDRRRGDRAVLVTSPSRRAGPGV